MRNMVIIFFVAIFFLAGATGVDAQKLYIVVTQSSFDYGFLKLYGIVENEGFSSANILFRHRIYLVIWHGSTLLTKSRIYPEVHLIRSGDRIGWRTIESIPEYVGHNWRWEIFVENCDFRVKYP
jgi:hypothetical protein